MPDHPGQEEDGTASAGQAQQLLATPVITDQDVLGRVTAITGPRAGQDPGRTLWLLFFDSSGMQANIAVPVDDIPERPDPSAIANICYVASEALAEGLPGGSAVITLSRPGTAAITPSDRYILNALRRGARQHGTPLRMLCLATAEGARDRGRARGKAVPCQAPGRQSWRRSARR